MLLDHGDFATAALHIGLVQFERLWRDAVGLDDEDRLSERRTGRRSGTGNGVDGLAMLRFSLGFGHLGWNQVIGVNQVEDVRFRRPWTCVFILRAGESRGGRGET